jgi:DNA topoisomerase-1
MPTLLRHSSDREPGISREKKGQNGSSYTYRHANGKVVKHPKTLERINLLGLPPAYRDVWICADEHGHLQATGIDERGRKQYRYHEAWSAFRAQKKFDHLVDFAKALPALRRRVRQDLKRETPDKTFVSAALIRLIDRTSIRVGNQYYAKENGSYGATTLRRKHVKLSDDRLSLDFTAKGGKRVRCTTSDKTLNHILHRIDELPGQRLFQYLSETDDLCSLDSSDVNDYLRDGFSAKTFRTWRGTVTAFKTAAKADKPTIKTLSEAAASALHNTPTICRNSYIHPQVIELARMNPEEKALKMEAVSDAQIRGLRKAEARCLAYLEKTAAVSR